MKKLLLMAIMNGVFLLCFSPVHATQVYYSDFETGAPNFSGVVSLEGTQGYSDYGFGDYFLRNDSAGDPASSTVLCLTDLPDHTGIELNFLLAIIDSWDGETLWGTGSGYPDYFNVWVDGASVFSTTFDNFYSDDQYYNPGTGAQLTSRNSGIFEFENFAYGSGPDAAYDMGLDPDFDNIAHTGSSLTIAWLASGDGWDGGLNESWAIDNVEVILNGTTPVPEPASSPYSSEGSAPVPEPATMLLLGSGLLGLAGLRRKFKK